MDTKVLISLLNKLLSADVFLSVSSGDLGFLQEIINPNNLFDEFTSGYLSDLIGSMKEKTFYELINTMGERLLLFRCHPGCVVIGPYLKRVIDENEITRRMIANKIPGYYFNILKTQYSSCAILDTQNICDVASSCISALSSDEIASYDFVKINNFETPSLVSADRNAGDEVYEHIYRKYETENELIFRIEHGLVDELKASFKRMKELNRSSIEIEYFSRHPKEAMASMRAMARMAAVRSGLSVVIIDGIMSKYTHLMRDAETVRESERLLEAFQLEMASAVREHLARIPAGCSDLITKVAEYIVLHYNRELTLGDVAKRFSINPSHLSRTFKNETGKGFKEFIEEIRISNAARYLETTDMSIGQISDTVGYFDNNYFSKVFRKITGKTPRDYRASIPVSSKSK